MKRRLARLLSWLPHSLAARLPLLVLAAYLLGALTMGWTVWSLERRGSEVDLAASSGEALLRLLQTSARLTDSTGALRESGPFQGTVHPELQQSLGSAAVPLILDLDSLRLRAAVDFHQAPKLPHLLRAAENSHPAARLDDLAQGIARQDQVARLIVFLPRGDVLAIEAPTIWRARISQTLLFLFGVLIVLGAALCVAPLAVHLAAPFRRLATADGVPVDLGFLPSSEAQQTKLRIERLSEEFRAEQDRKLRGIAAISHDLRTPVTRLRLRTEMLEDDTIRERFQSDLDEVASVVDGALDLLSLRARTETMYRFSLLALVDSMVTDYRDTGRDVVLIHQENLRMRGTGSLFGSGGTTSVRAAGDLILRGQPDKLRRALSNLVDNALAYGEMAEITVAPLAGGRLGVQIDDRGPGIDQARLDEVRLPFVRGANAAGTKGSGLGLAIAQEIVEGHGGELRLSNTPLGLRVRVILPRATAE